MCLIHRRLANCTRLYLATMEVLLVKIFVNAIYIGQWLSQHFQCCDGHYLNHLCKQWVTVLKKSSSSLNKITLLWRKSRDQSGSCSPLMATVCLLILHDTSRPAPSPAAPPPAARGWPLASPPPLIGRRARQSGLIGHNPRAGRECPKSQWQPVKASWEL